MKINNRASTASRHGQFELRPIIVLETQAYVVGMK